MKLSLLKTFLLLFLIVLLFFSSTTLGLTDSPGLEVRYPEIDGVRPLYAEGEGLPDYISYMVQFLIVLAIIITVFSLVRGGISIVIARDDPVKMKEGKDRVASALFGLIIVLFSVVFLSSLDPSLTKLEELEVTEVEEGEPPGIYLSEGDSIPGDIDEAEEDIYRIRQSKRNLEDTVVRSIRIINQLDERGDLLGYYYAVLFHEEPAFRGRCEFVFNDSTTSKDFSVPPGTSSITVIPVNNAPLEEGEVTAYLRPDFNENYAYEGLDTHKRTFNELSIDEVWSLDIDGNYGVILSSGESWNTTEDGCGVFLDSKPLPDLKEHHMNKCNPREMMPIYAAYDSCATHYIVLPLFN